MTTCPLCQSTLPQLVSLFTGLAKSFNNTYCKDSVLEQLFLAMAMVDGPMKANSTSPEGARTYLQSKAQIQGYLEVCNQRRTFLAWAAFHIHQLTLELVTLFNPLQAWGSNFVALVQTLESGRLVGFRSLVCLVGCTCLLQLNPANIQASFSLLNKSLLFFTNW